MLPLVNLMYYFLVSLLADIIVIEKPIRPPVGEWLGVGLTSYCSHLAVRGVNSSESLKLFFSA